MWEMFAASILMAITSMSWADRAAGETGGLTGILPAATRWICALDIPGTRAEVLARGIHRQAP